MGISQPILKNLSDYKQKTTQYILSLHPNRIISGLKTHLFKGYKL